jgi:hypothetical protein
MVQNIFMIFKKKMTTPVEESTNVGYCLAADVYCSFTEYYGNGTVYGWRHLYIGSEVVRGAGRTKRDLIAAGAVQEEAICPAVPADVVVLALDPVPVPEAPAPAPEIPLVAQPEAPEMPQALEMPELCACSDSCPCSVKELSSVTVKCNGFTVTLKGKITSDVTVEVSEEKGLTFIL